MAFADGDVVLLLGEENTYLREIDRDIQVAEGIVDPDDLTGCEPGDAVKTHTGERFTVLEPRLNDLLDGFDRTAQVVTAKDTGAIIAETGLGSGDTVVEAGTGSGFLAARLARVADSVHSCEVRDDFYRNAQGNLDRFPNVTVEHRDVKEDGFGVDGADLAVLDMSHPEEALEGAADALAPGGFLAVYCPVVEQVQDVTTALDARFQRLRVLEAEQREWRVHPTRPEPQTVPHTAFLVLARYVGEN